jgi:membrane-associated phospholipid phosphatase
VEVAIFRFTTTWVALTAVLLCAPIAAHGAPADSTHGGATPADVQAHPPVPHLVTKHDLVFLGGTAAITWVTMANDEWLTDKLQASQDTPGLTNLAKIVQPLGNAAVILPAALIVWQVAQHTGHPHTARRAFRVGAAVTVAGGFTTVLKASFGRWRPYESPDDPYKFDPFSGHASFPSGHATVAFAAATALDRETSSRWIPWVVYPAASLVAWSRVHDLQHWSSDVIVGAAIGGWTAWKTEDFLAHRALGVHEEHRTSFHLVPSAGGGVELVAVHSFQ